MHKPTFFLILVISPFSAWAEPFSFNAVNPSFGGNPNNGSHLLSVASKQYTPPLIERKKQSDLDRYMNYQMMFLIKKLAPEKAIELFCENISNDLDIIYLW